MSPYRVSAIRTKNRQEMNPQTADTNLEKPSIQKAIIKNPFNGIPNLPDIHHQIIRAAAVRDRHQEVRIPKHIRDLNPHKMTAIRVRQKLMLTGRISRHGHPKIIQDRRIPIIPGILSHHGHPTLITSLHGRTRTPAEVILLHQIPEAVRAILHHRGQATADLTRRRRDRAVAVQVVRAEAEENKSELSIVL